MGKACTKDANFARGDQLLPSKEKLYNQPVKEGSVYSRQASGQVEASFVAPEIRPPHSVLKESIHDLSKSHKFYIYLYGLKARNLKLRNTASDATTFCVVNWDDFAFERRTKRANGGPNPKWSDTMQFYWTVPNLSQLKDRFLVLHVYEELAGKTRIIGTTKLDLMTIGSGPVHNDLKIFENEKSKLKVNEVGRLIFDVKMAQDIIFYDLNESQKSLLHHINNLQMILVHLHESLDALDQLEVEGIGTKRPASSESLTRAPSNLQPSIQKSTQEYPSKPKSESTHDSTNNSVLPDLLSAYTTTTPSLRTSVSAAELRDGQGSLSLSSTPGIYSSLSFSTRRRQEQDESESRSLVEDISGVHLPSVETLVEEEDIEEVLDSKLERSATGGHTDADELDPFVAEWQLTFAPTGVDNPVEYCASWTPLCDQPYWNAVDHSIVDKLTAVDLCVIDTGGASPKHSGQLSSEPLCQLQAIQEDHENAVDTSEPQTNSMRKSLQSTPISKVECKSLSSPRRTVFGSSAAMITKKEQILEQEITSDRPIGNSTDQAKRSIPSCTEFSASAMRLTPSAVMKTLVAQHMHHLDPQLTYQKLAQICRKGRLVREMLYEDLPTIQLETTSDFLRQNHLKLRLYAKRLGFDCPKFYGETWLPFFKIYDADVVEQMHQNFSDSYFHEKLWFEGRCIGHVEGVIVFQNNPMIRQMLAGVNTDEGFSRISPPILGAEHKSVKFVFRNQESLPEEMRKLSNLHQSLLEILFSKTQHVSTEAASLVGIGQAAGGSHSPKSKISQLLHRKKISTAVSPVTTTPHPGEFKGSHHELHDVCDQVLQTLRTSHVETRRSFLYQTDVALLIGQRVLINLANHTLEFVDAVPWQYRTTYSAILHQTLRRGELDLGSCLPQPPKEMVALTGEERYALHFAVKQLHASAPNRQLASRIGSISPKEATNVAQSGRCSRTIQQILTKLTSEGVDNVLIYHRRMKVCRQYWLLLHRVKWYCLTKLCSDCVFEGQRKYISIFLSITYFRSPDFRRELLDCILQKDERDMILPEWRGTEFELDAETLTKLEEWQPLSEHRIALDWIPMSEALKEYFGQDAMDELLKTRPAPPEGWHDVFRSRGPSFFSFVEHWAKHVYQSVQNRNSLRWHLLPGYASLLKATLVEMKSRETTKYPDALLNSSGAMLANERLLSVFIKILFLKTSVYNSAAVFAALNYVDYWIQVLSIREQPLPPNFDHRFLRRGLDIIIGSDIGLSMAKAIWFIYKNLPTFKGVQLRVFLIDLLFERYFFSYVQKYKSK